MTHHQLDVGPDRTLEVWRILHRGKKKTAIVGMSQKAMHARDNFHPATLKGK
jgi:hypothetical protein